MTAFLVVLAILASYPFSLLIGPMYWDTHIYLDAAARISQGQVPNVDFFAPVGPLGYYLFAILNRIFPAGQPLLLADWSILIAAAPAMALILADTAGRSKATAFGLLIPFVIFAALPFNVVQFYPYPGVDGFGIYNRHGALLLYLLVATVLFVENAAARIILLSLLTLALFLIKVTAFVSGGFVLAFAFACGIIRLRTALITAFVFFVVLAIWQLYNGTPYAYVENILALAERNEGVLLSRFLTAGSIFSSIVAAGGLLCLYLLILDFRDGHGRFRPMPNAISLDSSANVLHRDWLWLGIAIFAGLFFETQNTGSQAFILLWPVLLKTMLRDLPRTRTYHMVAAFLVAFICIPVAGGVLNKAIRTFAVSLQADYRTMENSNLGKVGHVVSKPVFKERAARMKTYLARHHDASDDLARMGELPSFLMYSDPSYQLQWLMMYDEVIDAIRAYEREHDVRFDTIFTLDFTNIVPYLMERRAPLYVTIGADPFRAVPPPDAETIAAVENTDLVLQPKCPTTPAILELEKIYRPALEKHRKIEFDECFDAYILDKKEPAK